MSTTLTTEQAFTCVIDLFKRQVKKSPDRTSLIFRGDRMTYEELDRASNQFAWYLREKGVRANTLVGCSLAKSLDLIVSILGILKAGGVYLPLEPAYPQGRINLMVKDAAPQVLLIEANRRSQFTSFSGELILVDGDKEKILRFSAARPPVPISPKQLAYVIYTSGSTGKPKGIMVSHGSFAHGIMSHEKYYQKNLIGLLSSAISFDVSILTIFYLLASGGTICICEDEQVADAKKLVDIIENYAINYILCVPSLYSMILDRRHLLPSLKIVSLTGENISNSIPKLHAEFAPNAILYNEYGPSEYAIGTTIGKIFDPDRREIYPVNAGKPLPGTNISILDERLLSVPNSVKGEIFISGAGLSEGYLNNSGLTAEKFLSSGAATLYKTSDFGRLLPDGNLELLGRIDNQVKIRGKRVELGEIEQTICRYPQINEAVVVCKKYNVSSQLIAYFTALNGETIREELRAYLKDTLPEHMVPSAFIPLQSFPRTPNGKIDRDALSDLSEKEQKGVAEASSNLEQSLFDIWRKVLCLKSVDREDNFFDLGGDSLGIARVQTLIEEELAIPVPVTALLQYPTLSQLTHYLAQKESLEETSSRGRRKREAFQKFKTRVLR